jgi:hypothetical protein
MFDIDKSCKDMETLSHYMTIINEARIVVSGFCRNTYPNSDMDFQICVQMYEQFQVVFTTLADAVFATIIRKISFLSMPR